MNKQGTIHITAYKRIVTNQGFILSFILIYVLLLAGCTKYLEENPDSRVEPSTAEDFHAILTAAYPGAYHLFTEVMTDNYRFFDYNDWNSATLESWFKPLYLWSDNYSLNLPIGPEYAWGEYYNSIYQANVVLEGIEQATGEKPFLQHIRGEALLVRAYAHFMLVNLFANQYNKSTAANDLGIPYAMETEKSGIVNYARNKIADVYEKIENDALEGIEYLNNTFVDEPKFHFTKASAYAFLSRYYQFKEDWNKCIEYSNKALELNNTVRDLILDYNSFFEENDFEGFSNDYFSPTKDNILLINRVLEWNSYPATGFYANDFRAEFRSGDLRGGLFVFNDNTNINWHTLKFIGQFKEGQQYSNAPLFSVEEVYLNRAEASVRKQNPNITSAISDLNTLLTKRYENFTPLVLSNFQNSGIPVEIAVLFRIIDERQYELCYEGFRWFDLKRFQFQLLHDTEFGPVVLASDDPRYVLQIPQKELEANELMIPNPR